MRTIWALVLFVVLGAGASACGSDDSGSRQVVGPTTTTTTTVPIASEDAPQEAPDTSSAPTTTTTSTTEPPVVRAFNGREVPVSPMSAEEAAQLLARVDVGLRDESLSADAHAELGHQEQVVIRTLIRNPDWVPDVLAASTPELAALIDLHLQARSSLSSLHTAPPIASIPAWEVIEPEPLAVLIGHYQQAEADTGIEWEILAGINLIETGFGRIDGLSSAGAQGPMQFLPTTWEEVSEGGDIDDPGDAIAGAARYLVRRGGLDDIRAGLWGYNNSDDYVDAVLTYAELIRLDERTLRGIYNWEVYVGTEEGSLWLPVGFRTEEPLPAIKYITDFPWADTVPRTDPSAN